MVWGGGVEHAAGAGDWCTKNGNRTKSWLVGEALRHYFARRIPVVSASDEELAAIRRGRAAIKKGQFVTLEQVLHDLAPQNRKAGRKRA